MTYKQKITLKIALKHYIDKFDKWLLKGNLESRTQQLGFLADTGARRLRELYAEGLIQRKLEKGRKEKLVWYKRI